MVCDNAKKLSVNYKTASLLEAVIEYWLFYEMSSEMILTEDIDADRQIDIVRACFEELEKSGDISSFKGELETCRNEIIEKMQVLTSYVDKFLVYEYVLNRIEAKYVMTEQELDEKIKSVDVEKFVSEIASYILSTEEPAAINDRIREIIEQLPVRMARSKFIEYIKNSLKLYQDSDIISLDGYVYMIRTAAMIYNPDGTDKYFVAFKELLDEMSKADYKELSPEAYNIFDNKLKVAVSKLNDISDIYASLQKIINTLYTYLLNYDADIDNNVYENCIEIAGIVNNAFDGELLSDAADECFSKIEGVMEQLYEERLIYEAMLGNEIAEDDDLYDCLSKSEKLMSSSLFADIESEPATESVTDEYLEKVTDELVADLQEVIKMHGRPIVRAIYAMVLGKLPVFFTSMQEVVDYISGSVTECGDKAELAAVYSLLDDISADISDWSE